MNVAYPYIQPASSLWIGDAEVDYMAVRNLGCPIWLLSSGLREKEYLQSLKPDFLSDSINEVDLEKVGSENVH